MKTCSIIVPFYNAAKTLPKCLDSLIHQTYTALEILLVNDGSTDNSLAIAEAFASADTRICIISQANQGQAVARNQAINIATGEWVYFVDADDYIDSNYIETLVREIGDNDVLHIGSSYTYYHYTAPWKRLYRRQWLEQHQLRFPENLRHYEDIPFALNLWSTHPAYTCKEVDGYHYTVLSASNSRNGNRMSRQDVYHMIRKSRAGFCLRLYTLLRLKMYFLIHTINPDQR